MQIRTSRAGGLRRCLALSLAAAFALTGLGQATASASATTSGRAAGPASATAGSTGLAAPDALRLGHVVLHKCLKSPLAYCGRIAVPLDYSSHASPDIHIAFRWLPATATAHPAGTILAVEGGPGFATTGTESAYVAMAGSLLQTRNMLLVNLRGTGGSALVNCPGLEHFGQIQNQAGPAFDRAVGACGAQLNHTWHYRHGGWVHASDLFNTAYSARDVFGVLQSLAVGRVDLYGDSYGSWFAQVFASRYSQKLRSLTLDSTYQVLRLDPWYTSTLQTARTAFDQACSLSAACSKAASGPAWDRIGALARRLERAPVSGVTATGDGTTARLTVTAETLVNLVNNAGFDPVVYQDLDAAARALIQDGDSAPLLRLAALSLGFDDTNYPLPEFSDGLYFAVSCTDYVQLFSRDASPAVRARQYSAALRREPRNTFAPFSIAQWTGLDQYTEAYSACLDWPSPAHHNAPIARRPPLVPASVPVLILSGTLDSLTPRLRGATLVASQLGKSARLVTFANLTHVMLQDANDACPATIYQGFIQKPGSLRQLSTSCAARVSPIHTVGSYPLKLADATPASAQPGNTAGLQALQAASVAVASVGDEISRWPLLGSETDRGLRGGRVTFSGGQQLTIKLTNVRWVKDAVVNGTAYWNQATGWVTAHVNVRPATGALVRLVARWQPFGPQSQLATITGTQGAHQLAAEIPAP